MQEALIAALLADAGIAAVVGKRVFWAVLPQGRKLPCLILQTVTGRREYTMRGRARLTYNLVQIDGWASTFEEVQVLKRAVISLVDTFTTPPLQAEIEAERDSFEVGDAPPVGGVKPSDYHRASLDIGLWSTEA